MTNADKELFASIPTIDATLLDIDRRLRTIDNDLHDGIYGESPSTEANDKADMPTQSLASHVSRLEGILNLLTSIEAHTTRIHQSSSDKTGS